MYHCKLDLANKFVEIATMKVATIRKWYLQASLLPSVEKFPLLETHN